MDKLEIKRMLMDKELTVKGAITLYLKQGPVDRKEVVEFLGVSEKSFYNAINDYRGNLKTNVKQKSTQYSLEK